MKNMKSFLTALTLGAAALTAHATPASEGFGLGVVLGSPSGLSLKIPASPANSINVIAGWDLDDRDRGPGFDDDCCSSFYIGGDYIFYNYNLIRVTKGRMPLYYGPGLNASFWDAPGNNDNVRVGFRIALGVEYQFANAPFDIFLEIAPGLNVIPSTDGYISAGLGTRFFF